MSFKNPFCFSHQRNFAVGLVLTLSASSALPQQEQTTSSVSEWASLRQSMEKMHESMMATHPSKSGDMDFVKLMLAHHQAAIEMAKAQLLHGTDPQIRRLAQEIIADQQSEIELMQLWLKQHDDSK